MLHFKRIVCTLLLTLRTIDAASSGILDSAGCLDAKTTKWGCDPTKYTNGDHLQCTGDPTMGHMSWTGRPVYTNAFTLRTGKGSDATQDSTSYVPNRYLSIYLTVANYTQKYRGLLLHAVDKNGDFVGQWNITSRGKDAMFHNPPHCKRSIMHSMAELKPLRVEFRFWAPPAGTGPISFRCLIKVGPANDGWFYFPNGNSSNLNGAAPDGGGFGHGYDLTLSEAFTAPRSTYWIKGSKGQSCSEACEALQLKCSESELRKGDTATGSGLENAVGHTTSCPVPVEATCSNVAPAQSADSTCWYNAANSDYRKSEICASAGGQGTDREKTACLASHPNASRFCACKARSARRFFSSLRKSSAESVTNPAKPQATNNGGILSGLVAALSPLLKAGLAFGLLKFGGAKAFVTGMLFLCAPEVSAHNWMRSPSRASFEASTQKPFRQRKSIDIHAQLGPGQRMAIKWATGHSRPHYFVVLSGQDEGMTRKTDYIAMVEDYIALAPAGANKAALYPRLHSCKVESDCTSDIPSIYKERVTSSSPHFCEHPHYPDGTNLFSYKDSLLTDDVHLFYESEKYPWIIGVLKYENLYHLAKDEDIACLPVPARAGKGRHYIVHWVWRGYYDAIDVHTHPTVVPEELIYGNATEKFEWNKIDHCQYQNPKRVITPVLDATASARPCKDLMDHSYKDNTAKYEIATPGIAVVPAANQGVLPGQQDNGVPLIPYGKNYPDTGTVWPMDYQVLAAESLVMPTVQTVHSISSSDWESRTTITTDTTCNSIFKTYDDVTWRHAVEECMAYTDNQKRKCTKIAWVHNGQPQAAMFTGKHKFYRCRDGQTKSSTTVHVYEMKSSINTAASEFVDPATWTDNNHDRYQVSYQPTSAPTQAPIPALPGNWVADTGGAFGTKSGLSYGWNCAVPSSSMLASRSNFNDNSLDATYTGYVSSSVWDQKCPNGDWRAWEIAVPNGVYMVTMQGGKGCLVENVVTTRFRNANAVEVEVLDGKLTIKAELTTYTSVGDPNPILRSCGDFNWVQIDKISDSLKEGWLRGTTNEAWQQSELEKDPTTGDYEPIGLVTIEMPRAYEFTSAQPGRAKVFGTGDCRQWWMMSSKGGPTCYNEFLTIAANGNKPHDFVKDVNYKDTSTSVPDGSKTTDRARFAGGSFDSNEGFEVSISDTTCTDNGGCPDAAPSQVCGIVTEFPRCQYTEYGSGPCAVRVDCNGKTGKYVRVRLRRTPSEKKLFPAATKIRVHRQTLKMTPDASNGDKPFHVCYGVDPRMGSTTSPEFVVAEDPHDPAFYSTCYKRTQLVQWLPIEQATEAAEDRWEYGGQCLACSSFEANKNSNIYNFTEMATPWWQMDEACVDCTSKKASFAGYQSFVDPGGPEGGGDGDADASKNSGSGFKSSDVLVVLLIGSAGVGVIVTLAAYWKRSRRDDGNDHLRRSSVALEDEVAGAELTDVRLSSTGRAPRVNKALTNERTAMKYNFDVPDDGKRVVNSGPDGWAEHFTEDGVPYYFNATTGESTWTAPPSRAGTFV